MNLKRRCCIDLLHHQNNITWWREGHELRVHCLMLSDSCFMLSDIMIMQLRREVQVLGTLENIQFMSNAPPPTTGSAEPIDTTFRSCRFCFVLQVFGVRVRPRCSWCCGAVSFSLAGLQAVSAQEGERATI